MIFRRQALIIDTHRLTVDDDRLNAASADTTTADATGVITMTMLDCCRMMLLVLLLLSRFVLIELTDDGVITAVRLMMK